VFKIMFLWNSFIVKWNLLWYSNIKKYVIINYSITFLLTKSRKVICALKQDSATTGWVRGQYLCVFSQLGATYTTSPDHLGHIELGYVEILTHIFYIVLPNIVLLFCYNGKQSIIQIDIYFLTIVWFIKKFEILL